MTAVLLVESRAVSGASVSVSVVSIDLLLQRMPARISAAPIIPRSSSFSPNIIQPKKVAPSGFSAHSWLTRSAERGL